MKFMTLSCKDMGAACEYVAEGQSKEDVKKIMMDHAMTDHKEMMDKMSDVEKDEMMKKMDALIKA